jgi:hypothetical protein
MKSFIAAIDQNEIAARDVIDATGYEMMHAGTLTVGYYPFRLPVFNVCIKAASMRAATAAVRKARVTLISIREAAQ